MPEPGTVSNPGAQNVHGENQWYKPRGKPGPKFRSKLRGIYRERINGINPGASPAPDSAASCGEFTGRD